jgi:hypothetical protein
MSWWLRVPLACCGMLTKPNCERGFQFSGTINRVCSGGLYRPPSRIISSKTTIGGMRVLSLRLLAAITIAFSKLSFLLRRDSTVYHAAPLHGFPLIRGMVRFQWMTQELPIGVGLLLRVGEVAESSRRSSGEGERLLRCWCFYGAKVFRSDLLPGLAARIVSTNAIPISITTTIAASIKLCWIVRVPFPCARGLVC